MRRENNTSRNLKLEKKYKKMKEKYYFDDDFFKSQRFRNGVKQYIKLEMGGRQE